jgi:hypothetical protein
MTVGPGSLVVAAGTTTLVGGAGFDVGHWTVLGSTARMILDEALIYNGVFSAGSGAIVTISSGPLLLTGTVNFSGAKMTGTQRVKLSGATSASNLAIGGTGGFTNKGVLTESGVVKLGDGLGNTTQIYNAAPATWDIVNDVGITLGASPNSSILSLGLFEKTAGAGVSVIAPTFANSGHVMVSSGTLDFQNVVSGAGADTIAGAATLEFDSAVLNGQTISFVGSGGVLDLGLPTSFGGAIQGFDTVGSNDALALLGSWSIVGYAQNGSSQGVLTLYNGAQATALTFDGNYTQAQFAATTGSGHTTITIT